MAKFKFDLSQLSSGILVPVFVLVIGFIAYFAVTPIVKKVKADRRVLADKTAGAEIRGSQFLSVKNLISQLEEKKPQLADVETAVPAAPEIPELLANLDQLARQSGLVIANLDISSGEAAASGVGSARKAAAPVSADLGTIRLELTMEGVYANLKAFLFNAEQNLRVMDIDMLDFGEINEKTGSQEYLVSMRTYYQKN